MKLTTKRNRWYFWRELFTYMIPMILIVWTIDVFASFIKCPLHPEYSAPCSVNWIFAAIYGVPLILAIILAVISAKMLKKIKKRIEDDFFTSVKQDEDNIDAVQHEEKYKKQPNKQYRKKEGIMKMIEENKHEEDDIFEKWVKSKTKKSSETRKKSIKKIAKK